MEFKSKNSFQSLDTLTVSGKKYNFFNLVKAEKNGLKNIKKNFRKKKSECFVLAESGVKKQVIF